ncbi:MAG: ATP-dependent Clp protease ATP-binding subunit ClpX [bacterium]
MDTTKILFFGSGAFAGSAELDSIYDIANKRQGGVAQTNTQSGIGFITAKAEANPKNYESGVQDVEASDVVEYGLMSEITGRFTNIVTLSELSLDALRSIMTEPKDAELPGLIEDLKDFYNIDLEFDDEAMMEMAKLAKARKTGARAIPSVVNAIIFVISGFPEEYAGKKVIINKEAITDVSKMLVVDPETGKKIGKVIPVAEQVIATDEAKAEATSDENKPADEKPSSKE